MRWPLGLLAALISTGVGAAEDAAPLASTLAKLPVRELTAFKDGHAFVVHEGSLPVQPDGTVQLDVLPTPIMGTFWPYVSDKNVKLKSVTASRRRVAVERTAISLRDLLEANPGAEVFVTEFGTPPVSYGGKIVGFLNRTAAEVEATAATPAAEYVAQKSNLLQLNVTGGVKVLPIERIQDVKFVGAFKSKLVEEEYRNLLTLHLDWGAAERPPTATVGLTYVQRGFRWIPNYRVDIDGKGSAEVALQAMLLNELADVRAATVNLVVGVPTFDFKETIDPMALSHAVAALSPYFDQGSQLSNNFSNAIMTQTMSQTARMGEVGRRGGRGGGQEPAAPAMDLGPEIAGGAKNEDLYVYTIRNVTLGKGQRQVVHVATSKAQYKDVYTLNLPFNPPPMVLQHFNPNQNDELARLLAAPKVMHVLRLTNSTPHPFTTGPALLVAGRKVIAQSMMTYTARGATTDLAGTAAVDVGVKKTDVETKRTPNAENWNNATFARIDLSGSIQLTNHRDAPVALEVVRNVMGNVGEISADGKAEAINLIEDGDRAGRPFWWHWYSWPYWWSRFNGVSRIRWSHELAPGKSVELKYNWHYYWN